MRFSVGQTSLRMSSGRKRYSNREQSTSNRCVMTIHPCLCEKAKSDLSEIRNLVPRRGRGKQRDTRILTTIPRGLVAEGGFANCTSWIPNRESDVTRSATIGTRCRPTDQGTLLDGFLQGTLKTELERCSAREEFGSERTAVPDRFSGVKGSYLSEAAKDSLFPDLVGRRPRSAHI